MPSPGDSVEARAVIMPIVVHPVPGMACARAGRRARSWREMCIIFVAGGVKTGLGFEGEGVDG